MAKPLHQLQASALQGIRRPCHSTGLPQALNWSSAGPLPQIHSQYGQLPTQITRECKLHLSRSGVYCFSGAALAKCHKLGVLYNRNLFSHRSGAWKFKIKVPLDWFQVRPLFLACRQLSFAVSSQLPLHADLEKEKEKFLLSLSLIRTWVPMN